MYFKPRFTSTIIYKICLFLYVFLKPFYFFSSGIPQPADLLLVIVFIPFLYSLDINRLMDYKNFRYLLLFLLLVVVVNGYYFFLEFDSNTSYAYLISISFLLFNIIFFIFSYQLLSNFSNKDFKYLFYVIFISLFIQFLLLLFDFDKGIVNNFKGRAYLTFNNPNQLSYYCILLSTIVLISYKRVAIPLYIVTLIFSISLVLILKTESRPAIIGALVLFLYFIMTVFKEKAFKNLFIFLLPLSLIVLIQGDNINEEYLRMSNRFTRLEKTNKKELKQRGFSRIMEYPQYLIYGSGEGNFNRFVKKENVRAIEIHSSFITLWYCYGILGLLLFCLFLFYTLPKLSYFDLWALFPVFLCNIFHNGFRFTLFWFLLSFFFYFKKELPD